MAIDALHSLSKICFTNVESKHFIKEFEARSDKVFYFLFIDVVNVSEN